jgi:hypothetical protein
MKFPACVIALSDPFENTDFTHMGGTPAVRMFKLSSP